LNCYTYDELSFSEDGGNETMQLTLKNITLTYDQQANIFEHLNCIVPNGQLVALLGPSGSGKTTILNLIAGLLTPTAGQILFADTDVTQQDVRMRNIGMVFQDYALYPHFNVLDNIAFPLKMAHVKKTQRQKRAYELAKLVHVDELVDKFPNMLSGDQQQRVAIARALAKDPAILLLDEPLSNLDAALRIELRDEIRRIQQTTGITTIFVTHDQDDALRIADKIIVLANGQIQQSGTGTELYRRPQNLFVAQFIGAPKINTLPLAAIEPNITVSIPAAILAKANTVGIRSEAISLAATAKPLFAQLPVRKYSLAARYKPTATTKNIT
jgi:multiple sugar transport system ATP-binding protein